MLLDSPRFQPGDSEAWALAEKTDLVRSRLRKMGELEERALGALDAFARNGDCYVGVSWGKDSVTVAHLAWRLDLRAPVVWFPAGQIENPDCARVRDAFLARFPIDYREIEAAPASADDGVYGHDGAQHEFEAATRAFGSRYVSGVRAAESVTRRRRMAKWGEASPNTCAPIGWWPTEFVFAYLAKYDLPVHPAYACTMGGQLDREQIRVATIGGRRGRGHGRAEWERTYYPRAA